MQKKVTLTRINQDRQDTTKCSWLMPSQGPILVYRPFPIVFLSKQNSEFRLAQHLRQPRASLAIAHDFVLIMPLCAPTLLKFSPHPTSPDMCYHLAKLSICHRMMEERNCVLSILN